MLDVQSQGNFLNSLSFQKTVFILAKKQATGTTVNFSLNCRKNNGSNDIT